MQICEATDTGTIMHLFWGKTTLIFLMLFILFLRAWIKILNEVNTINFTLTANFRAFPMKSVVDNSSPNGRNF